MESSYILNMKHQVAPPEPFHPVSQSKTWEGELVQSLSADVSARTAQDAGAWRGPNASRETDSNKKDTLSLSEK